MLHKCANPACPCLFRSLSHGKLFLLQTDSLASVIPAIRSSSRHARSRRMERYWLCDACSPLLTLTFERGRGMVTVPLPARNSDRPAAHLTPMQPEMKVYPAEFGGGS